MTTNATDNGEITCSWAAAQTWLDLHARRPGDRMKRRQFSERRNCPGFRGVLSEVPEASMSAATARFSSFGSGRRPGKARTRAAGEPTAVTLQARGLIQVERDDDLVGRHQRLDHAAQPTQAQRDHRLTQIGCRADIATPLVEGHRDVKPSVLAHDAPRTD